MNETRSDVLLVEALRGGEREAFRALVDRYKGGITAYLFRRVHDRHWAEDLAQEVFLRAYRALPSFKAESRFSTWLYRIAHNLSVDFLKRKRLEPRLYSGGEDAGGGGEPELPDLSTEPGQEAIRRELRERVLETLGSLGVKYRDVFVLCAMQGLRYEEAAEVLDLSPKTVSSRLCRARKKFRVRMEPYLKGFSTEGTVNREGEGRCGT